MSQKIEYFRNRHNEKVGTFVGLSLGDKFTIGWSLCCKKDQYKKDLGIELAAGRAWKKLATGVNGHEIPNSMKYHYEYVQEKWSRYFKDKKFV